MKEQDYYDLMTLLAKLKYAAGKGISLGNEYSLICNETIKVVDYLMKNCLVEIEE